MTHGKNTIPTEPNKTRPVPGVEQVLKKSFRKDQTT